MCITSSKPGATCRHSRRPWLRATLAALALLLATRGAAFDLRTAAQEASAPKFVSVQRDGRPHIGGLCIDIMHAIEQLEPDLVFVGTQRWQPPARLEAGVAAGTLDVACGFLRTARREARVRYLDPPLFPVRYYLAVRADDDVQVRDWDDVRRLGERGTLLLVHGYGINDLLARAGGLRVDAGGRDSATNLGKLLAGRGRFYLHRVPGLQWEIVHGGLQGRVKVLAPAMHSELFYMIVSRTLPAAVGARLAGAIGRLRANGTLDQLLALWTDEALLR